MNQRHLSPTLLASALALAITTLLTACGGGGSAAGEPAAAVAAAPASLPAEVSTVAGIVPGATMTWATAADRTLGITVTGADGRPAAGAGVRVFSLSRSSPQDGSALEQPVPMSLLDSAVSDASGHVSLALQLPAHLDEVLIVATLADTRAQRAVATDGSAGNVELALTR
jgi:hypothetical protein